MILKKTFLPFIIIFLALTAFSSVWASEQEDDLQNSRDLAERLFQSEDDIIGLELIVADGSDGAFYSKWGHAMLRFVSASGGVFDDYIVSMVANINPENQITQKELIEKGLLGGFSVLPFIKTSAGFWQDYVLKEGRPLRRYIISSSPKNRHQLLVTLKKWTEHPEQIGDYTFLTNNCAGALAKLLEQSGFPKANELFAPRIPTNLPDWAAWSTLSLFSPIVVENYSSIFKKSARLMNLNIKDFYAGKWPKNAIDQISKLEDREIKQLNIVFESTPVASEIMSKAMKQHSYRSGATLEEVMGFRKIPTALYEICSDENCALEQLRLEKITWDETQYKEAQRLRDFVYWSIFADRSAEPPQELSFKEPLSKASKSLKNSPEFLQNLQLILRVENENKGSLTSN